MDDLLNNAQGTIKLLCNQWNLFLIGLVWLSLHTMQERFSELFEKPKLGWRLLPFLPALITVPASFVPGPWFPPELQATVPMKLLLGCMLGFAAYNFGGIANRLGLTTVANKLGVEWVVDKTTPAPRPVTAVSGGETTMAVPPGVGGE